MLGAAPPVELAPPLELMAPVVPVVESELEEEEVVVASYELVVVTPVVISFGGAELELEPHASVQASAPRAATKVRVLGEARIVGSSVAEWVERNWNARRVRWGPSLVRSQFRGHSVQKPELMESSSEGPLKGHRSRGTWIGGLILVAVALGATWLSNSLFVAPSRSTPSGPSGSAKDGAGGQLVDVALGTSVEPEAKIGDSPARVAGPPPSPLLDATDPKIHGGKADGPEIEAKGAKVSPHPTSPERTRLYTERMTMEQAKAAARARDPVALTEVLDNFDRDQSSGQFDDWYDAYRVIVECLNEPGAESTAVGARFVTAHPGSTMRRSVRKYCNVSR